MLKKTIRLFVSVLTMGFVLGAVRGVIHVLRNRYIEVELYSLALDSFFRSTFETIIYSIPILIGIFLLYSLIFRWSRSEEGARRRFGFIAALSIFLILWIYGGRFFNDVSWYPSFWSIAGVLSNIGLTLLFAGISFLSYKWMAKTDMGGMWSIGNRAFYGYLAVLILLLVARQVIPNSRIQNPINILFISVDTLRSDHLGCYGYERDTSPTIDELARSGALFRHAIVQWPKTSPSFASMMTSTYGHKNGVRLPRQRLGDFNTTIAEVLCNGGYQTAGIVGNGNLAQEFSFHQGFKWYQEPWNEYSGDDNEKSGCDATSLTNRAIEWIEKHSDEGNFFLWIHYIDPHARYVPPSPFDTLFVNDPHYGKNEIRMVLNEGLNDDIGGVPERSRLGDHDLLNYYLAQYDGEIRYMDEEIGRLMTFVTDTGLWENLLVIFTSDHGESLGEHDYYFEHGRLPYDTCAKVPLILSGGALPWKGVQSDRPVAILDIFPTILDIVGIRVTGEEAGISLRHLFEETGEEGPAFVFMESGYEWPYQRSIRDGRWKLIYIPNEDTREIMDGTEFELYDTLTDPYETNNLIEQEREIAESMKAELFDWMARTKSLGDIEPSHATVAVEKETEAYLKALGYVQ